MGQINAVLGIIGILLVVFFPPKVVQEGERFAIFAFGKFKRLVPPGIRFKSRFFGEDWFRIRAGATGSLLNQELVEISGNHIPAIVEGSVQPGDPVRVRDFTQNELIVIKDQNARQVLQCENCGHEMRV